MKPIAGTGQHDVAARGVVFSGDREIERIFVLRVSSCKDRGPASIRPQWILFILSPRHEIVATGQADTAAFVQPVPSPITESSTFQFQYRHGVRELVAFPLLRVGKHVARCCELEVRHSLGGLLRKTSSSHGKNEKRQSNQNPDLMNSAEHVCSSSKFTDIVYFWFAIAVLIVFHNEPRSEERRVGKECRSRWSPY